MRDAHAGRGRDRGGGADDSWEKVAPEWERHRARVFDGFRQVSDWLIEQVRPKPGDTILELAAGPGETGFLAADRIGPSGRLISTDLALRAGGRFAYSVMGTPDRNQWMSVMVGALMQAGQAPVGGNPFQLGGVFGMSSPEVNQDLLTDAGFSDVLAEELAGTMRFDGVDDYWTFQSALAGPVRITVEKMTDDEVSAARSALDAMMAPFATNGGYELPTALVVVSAA